MVTHDDLSWWHETAARLDWIWAKTYADTAPHDYVVEGRTTGLSHDAFVRAGRVIHTFGKPAKFCGTTNIYLTSDDGRHRWWTMDPDVTSTSLINRATTDRLYGVQNAPITVSGVNTPYDAIATEYDASRPSSAEFSKSLRGAVDELRGHHLPAILDVGCGTGRVLDLALTDPERYAGVDPSAPMLNQLVRKHPNVGAVYPVTIQAALEQRLVTPGQFEIVTILMSDTEQLDKDALAALNAIASRGVVAAVGDDVEVTHAWDEASEITADFSEMMLSATPDADLAALTRAALTVLGYRYPTGSADVDVLLRGTPAPEPTESNGHEANDGRLDNTGAQAGSRAVRRVSGAAIPPCSGLPLMG